MVGKHWSLTVALAAAAPLAVAAAPPSAPLHVAPPATAATKQYELDCTFKQVAAQVDARQQLVDLPAGAVVREPPSTGDTCVSVMSGAVTVRPAISRRVQVRAGASLLLAPGDPYTLANDGKTPARLLITDLVSHGTAQVVGPLTLSSPPPTIARTLTVATSGAIGQTFQIVHRILTLPPYAHPQVYRSNGLAVNSVIAGTVTLKRAGTVAQVHSGQAWSNRSGEELTLQNNGTQPARIFTSVVVPVGSRPSPG